MLKDQVEVITILKMFLEKIILSTQFYLFAHVYLNLTSIFLPFCKINVKN